MDVLVIFKEMNRQLVWKWEFIISFVTKWKKNITAWGDSNYAVIFYSNVGSWVSEQLGKIINLEIVNFPKIARNSKMF